MVSQEKVFSLIDFGSKRRRAAPVGMDLHHQSSVRGGDSLATGARSKPKDLVGLLLGYGARTRRSAMPRVGVNLEVFTPSGNHAVKISFK